MAALTITAANVVAGSNATRDNGIAGVAVTAGQAVYRDPTTRKFLLSDADSATAAANNVDGIALHAASLNQPLAIQKAGDINLGATLAVGTIYVLDSTAGGIAPAADLGVNEFVVVLGVASSASNLRLDIQNSGAKVPA
jgi:hypothetical protein